MPDSVGVKRLARLKQKKHRERERLFLAEGESLIAESPSAPISTVYDPDDVRRLSSLTTPVGPVAVFPFLDVSAGDLLGSRERIVLLYRMQDPGNVGTIIRAAHAFEAGIAISRETADLYNPKTVRATMGSIFHAPISRELNPEIFIDEAEAHGFTTAAAVPNGGESPRAMPSGKLLIVAGAEGAGLPETIVSACSMRVSVQGEAESLNAAVAASILLYESYMHVLP